ncbi:PIF1 family ATP-dependent DNA helicase [Porticoccaceae bacterium]|jgi:ATP-dependent DNA helicase PIF1|nr:PIF1 family ATP-dependent DNA helicase [Porticoccaceae bacterium]
MFSPEQLKAYELFTQGHNVFITGPGGSGKSHLIREIVKDSNRRFLNIYVAALTGFAALLLQCEARTLHSCTGIGLGNKDVDDLVRQIRSNKRALAFWKTAQVFIVDEVSMLSALLFQKLNCIGQILRKNTRQFGGIQIIFSGDFYQLPPIGNKDELATRQFCFQCEEWNRVFKPQHQIPLLKIFRQTDEVYAGILNQLRVGTIKKSSIRKLNSRLWTNILASSPDEAKNTFPTQIFPIRSMVDNINTTKLSEIDSPSNVYTMDRKIDIIVSETRKSAMQRVTNADIHRELDYLSTNLTCDETLELKKGARVMIIINVLIDDTLKLCNGSQGTVIDFTITDEGKYPVVQFDNGVLEPVKPHTWVSERIPWVGVSQLPLLLSWAITIHKSQGITLDKGDVDVGNRVFSDGQTYVALSRIKSLDGLYLKSFDVSKITINADAQRYYKSLELIHSTKSSTIPSSIPLPLTNIQPRLEPKPHPLITSKYFIENKKSCSSPPTSSKSTLFVESKTNEFDAVLAPDPEPNISFDKFKCPK